MRVESLTVSLDTKKRNRFVSTQNSRRGSHSVDMVAGLRWSSQVLRPDARQSKTIGESTRSCARAREYLAPVKLDMMRTLGHTIGLS